MARLLALVLALAVLAACRGDPTPVVEVEQVRPAEVVETVSAPGRLAPAASAEVVAEVAGTVTAIEFDDGDEVAADAVVVRIDSPDLDEALAQVEDARAALDAMQAPAGLVAGDLGLPSAPPAPEPAPPSELGGFGAPPNPADALVGALDESVRPQLAAAREELPGLAAELERTLDGVHAELERWTDALADDLPPGVAGELAPPELDLPDPPDAAEVRRAVEGLEASYEDARAGLLAAGEASAAQQAAAGEALAAATGQVAAQVQASLDAAVGELAAAQAAVQQATLSALEQQAEQASAAQAAELDARAAQLEAQEEALTVEAPIDGVVELAGTGAPVPEVGALGGLGGLDPGGAGGGLGGTGLGGLGELAPQGGGDGAPLRVGARVAPGQPLFTVYDVSDWFVAVDIDEIDAPGVVVGQRADTVIDAFPGGRYEGVVETLRLAAEPSAVGAVVYPARIRLFAPPADPGPRVGMTASVDITTGVVDAELAVPSRAIVRRDGSDAVYAVRDGRAEVVPVTVDALGEELAAVTGALEAGERVVVAGYEELPDGAEVELE